MTTWQKLKTQRWFYWMWVALSFVGTIEYTYESYTGSGVSGWLMRWQIERFGALSEGLWGGLWFFPAMLLPFLLAIGTSGPLSEDPGTVEFGPSIVIGGISLSLLLLSAGAYWAGKQVPDLEAVSAKLDVAQSSGSVVDGMRQLTGVVQNEQSLRYTATWSTGNSGTVVSGAEIRNLIPVTGPQWRPGEPVQYLIATNERRLEKKQLPHGVLLANSLPWYKRSILERNSRSGVDPNCEIILA